MRINNLYAWNVVLLIIFCVLVVAGMKALDQYAYRPLYTITGGDILLITLATFRVIRLFVNDHIMAFFREQFLDEVPTIEVDGEALMVKPSKGIRRVLADLMFCPWCFGIWASAIVIFFYFLTPYAFYPVLFLAIAGIATFLQLLANLVANKVEQSN